MIFQTSLLEPLQAIASPATVVIPLGDDFREGRRGTPWRVYHTLVLATKPATAVAWQTGPTAVGRLPGATVGWSRPRGNHHPVWHRSARCFPCDRSRSPDHNLEAHAL